MKIIITGGTGFIGGAALRRLLALPDVTAVVALSRRELPVSDAKLENVIVKDFSKLDDTVLEKVKGAEGCVWVLGSPSSGLDVHDGYTMAALDAFTAHLLPALKDSGKTFRFVYTSGAAIERDQDKFLLFLGAVRKGRGVTETKLVATETQHTAATWKTLIARPGMVLKPSSPLLRALPTKWAINVDLLGAAMADLVVRSNEKQVFDNTELRDLGAAALARTDGAAAVAATA